MTPKVPSEGSLSARIMIVGEAPGNTEERVLRPFVGSSGQELDRMLSEAGILRTECYITNVCKYRPPNNEIEKFYLKNTPQQRVAGPEIEAGISELHADLARSSTEVIIALGDTALWALTGNRGIVKWRGSELELRNPREAVVVPTYHPASILRMWEWRFPAVCDLRRAKRILDGKRVLRERNYLLRPSFEEVLTRLARLANTAPRIAIDLETRAGHIACVGFAWSKGDAICIPLMCVERNEGYWSHEEEVAIIGALRQLFRRRDIEFVLQNGLYDLQYIVRYWGVQPRVHLDTMLGHHVCFLGQPKSLDYLSSIYCEEHVYWKDEGKTWTAGMDEEQLWRYNCEDAVRTWEISYEIEKMAKSLNREAQVAFQMQQFPAVLRMMLRGVRCDLSLKGKFTLELTEAQREREAWLQRATGLPFNVKSPKQMKEFFYGDLGLKEVRNRKTGEVTTNDEALTSLTKRYPWIDPITRRISELRSIGVFFSTFVNMSLDRDQRIRCSYNVAGTETLRYSSSENAFGSGTNLQNVPAGDGHLPNVRKMFVPDPGDEFAEFDLKGADAQVVAWEANDEKLKEIFRAGAELHIENAKDLFGLSVVTKDRREYALAKRGVHATNYGISVPSLAASLGITRHEAERFQRRWFTIHPGIRDWQRRVEDSIFTTRSVSNRFGFVRHYFGRIEGILPEALAWIPQSTVAIVISTGLIRIDQNLPSVKPVLQVHDSLVLQYEARKRSIALPAIREQMSVLVPYDDPLIIPVEVKVSDRSWGDAKKLAF